MVIGKIEVTTDVTPENRSSIINDTLALIRSKHPMIDIEESSLQTDELESDGIIRYMVGDMGRTSSSDFPIIVAKSKKN